MKNYKILLLVLCAAAVNHSFAQQSFTLYPMRSIPQSNMLNPANVPDCKWFVGIPAINSISMQYANSGFNLRNITRAIEETDSSYTLNLNKLTDVFNKKNYVAMRGEVSWLQGGIQYKKHYAHFSVIEKAIVQLSYPKDLFRLLLDGNGETNLGSTFNLHFKATAMHYRETALGYSYAISDKLRLGGRIKYLKGLNYVGTKVADLDFTTNSDDFSYKLKANLVVNSSSTIEKILKDSSDKSESDPKVKNFLKSKNKGLALDLGAMYQITDKLSLNASILDMGYIRWKENTSSYHMKNPNATFDFDGIHISSSDTNTAEQFLEEVADSLKSRFDLEQRNYNFSTALSAEFFIGANYSFNKSFSAGALFYGDFYNKRFYPGLTVNAQWKAGRALSLNVTNTMYSRSFLNLGLGVSGNLGPFQTYVVMDNVLFPVFFGRARVISLRFGTNLTFGRERMKPKKPKKKDSDGNTPGGDAWPG